MIITNGGKKILKQKIRIILLTLMFFSSSILILNITEKNNSAQATNRYVSITGGGNYTSIQTAINNAANDDTIYVWAGSYCEAINVNKRLSIIGNSSINTTVDGGGIDGGGFTINSENVTIKNFTIKNCNFTAEFSPGIYISNTVAPIINNCSISYCNITNNDFGIFVDDFNTYDLNNVSIHNNTFWKNNNDTHTGYYKSANICFSDETVNNYILIRDNTFVGCNKTGTTGIYFGGLSTYDVLTIGNNTFTNENCGIYNTNGGTNIFILNNIFNNNSVCMYLKSFQSVYVYNNIFNNSNIGINNTNKNYIYNNSFTNSTYGIYTYSDSNTIYNNIIVNNTYGVYLYKSGASEPTNNLFYNNYFNNTNNFKFTFTPISTSNELNIAKTLGINIIGGPYLGGNYWNNYTGKDFTGDGLGETPYNIGNELYDYYPLTDVGNYSVNMSVFNESNCNQGLIFDILITNRTGTQTFEQKNCTDTSEFPINLLPYGEKIQFVVSAEGYEQRVYTKDIEPNQNYFFKMYLPPATLVGSTEECSYRGYTDSKLITDPLLDLTINHTNNLESMINVELYYNNGTVSGWYFIPEDYYTYTTTETVIDSSAFDINTTMARVNYYYRFCEGGVESALYNLRVIDIAESSIEDAYVVVKRYMNCSGLYENVTSVYSDSNGYVNVYLVPSIPYKVFLYKTGYIDKISDYIPQPPNQFGQTDTKIFKLIPVTIGPQTPTFDFEDIHFITTMLSNTSIRIDYIDDTTSTLYTILTVTMYNYDTGVWTVNGTYTNYSQTSDNTIINLNRSNIYFFNLTYAHVDIGINNRQYILDRQITPPLTETIINTKFNWVGFIPIGISNLLMWLLLIAGMYYADERDIGKITIILGVLFLIINGFLGWSSDITIVFSGGIPVLFIVLGILMEWAQARRKEG